MGDEKDKGRRWVEVVAAPNQLEAEITVEFLRREGIPARLKPRDSLAFLGGMMSPLTTHVLVPEDREEEARAWIEAAPADDQR